MASLQWSAGTIAQKRTPDEVTGRMIANISPIADVEAPVSTETPDGMLDHAWECRRVGWVEASHVDIVSERSDYSLAPVLAGAPLAIGVVGSEGSKDPRPVEEVMDEAVDGHH